MNIGIHAPYLHICGGGEKYIGKVAEILSRDNEVSFVTFDEPDFGQLESRLHLNLSRVGMYRIQRGLPWRAVRQFRHLRWLVDLHYSRQISTLTKGFDLFINQEHLTFIRSHAKRSILICEVPPVKPRLKSNVITKSLFDPKAETYDTIVVNSGFTRNWAEKYYGREAVVLHPPVETESFRPRVKRNIVLSVGRFSRALHCKKQLEMIRAFKLLHERERAQGWEYHLAGGCAGNRAGMTYLNECKAEAAGYPVSFHINAPFDTLEHLYGIAKIFWHATGLGEDEDQHPERMEHFGITTVEAMSAGCVPVVISKGGQPEIVEAGVTGFLFHTINDLVEYTARLMNDDALWQRMSQASTKAARRFGMDEFERNVRALAAGHYRH